MKNKYQASYIINFLLMVIAVLFLCFFSVFYIGSEEDYLETMATAKMAFITNKILFSWIFSLAILLLIAAIFWIYNKIVPPSEKIAINRVLLVDLIVLFSVSIMAVLLYHL